jgi:hypothetical protein
MSAVLPALRRPVQSSARTGRFDNKEHTRVPVVGKLYFLLHGTRFAAKNACPQGDESHSEVARFFAMFEQSGVADEKKRKGVVATTFRLGGETP